MMNMKKMQNPENHCEQIPDMQPAQPVPSVSPTPRTGIFPGSAITWAVFSLLLIAMCAGAFFMGRISGQMSGWLPWKNDQSPEITEETVIERVRQVSKFVSAEYFMADVIEYENEQLIPFFDKKMLIIAKARVQAGFDFDKGISVTVEEREGQKQAVHITLPRPEIISVEPEYRYYDIRGNIPPEDHTLILARAKATLRGAAVRAGILDRAKESVQMRLPYLFPTSEVSITFSQERKKLNETDSHNPH